MATPSEIEKLERRWTENPAGLMFAPLAEAYRKAGSTDRALEILEVGLAVHPDYVPALIVRGRCQLDAGSLAEAEQTFQQVLARDPANVIALRGMADLFERSGRLPEAIERLELLSEMDRNNSEARAEVDRVKAALANGGLALDRADQSSAAAEPTSAEPESAEADQFQVEKSMEALSSGEEILAETDRATLAWNPVQVLGWDEPAEIVPAPAPGAEPSTEPLSELPLSSEPESPAIAAEGQSEPVAEEAVASPAPESVPEPAAEPGMDSRPVPWLAERSWADQPEAPSWIPAPEPVAEALPDAPEAQAEPTVDAAPEAQADVTVDAAPEPAEPSVESAPEPAPEPEPWWSAAASPLPAAVEPAAPAEPEAMAEPEPAPEPEPVPAFEAFAEPDAMAEPAAPVLEAQEPEAPAPEPEQPEPAEPAWQSVEVASEATVGESPVMSEPVPPESPEAADLPWPEVDQPEPVADSVAEEPALVVTESMAELFLKQGHRELALAVYRQLLDRSPESPSLVEAVTRLEGEVATRLVAGEPAPRPSRAASVTGGTSVEAMLRAVLASPPPAGNSTVLPPAIEPAAGPPARESEPLTLGQVFGDEPSVPPAGTETEPAGAAEPSFDQFFGAGPATAESPAAAGSRPSEGEDMRQFSEWLKGLKR